MKLPQEFYLKHIYSATSYRAAWFPNQPLRPGDIGRMDDGLFTVYTSLQQEGMRISTRETASGLGIDYSAKDSYTVSTSADAGQNAVKGKIAIQFGGDGGIVFQMTSSKLTVIDNLKELETAILARYRDKQWRKEWVVITELVMADNATILISTQKNTSIELACDVAGEFASIHLADPSINLRVTKESSNIIKLLSAGNVTPMYRIRGVRQPFLGNPGFRSSEDLTAAMDFTEQPFDAKEFT